MSNLLPLRPSTSHVYIYLILYFTILDISSIIYKLLFNNFVFREPKWRILKKSLPPRWSGSQGPWQSLRPPRTPPSRPPPSPRRPRRTWWRRWTGSPWSGATTRRPRRSLNSEGDLSSHSKSLLDVIFLVYHIYLYDLLIAKYIYHCAWIFSLWDSGFKSIFAYKDYNLKWFIKFEL